LQEFTYSLHRDPVQEARRRRDSVYRSNNYEIRCELVVFSSWEVKERAPYLGERRLTPGEPSRKSLDRESVKALVREEV
jgi:hypothetical protein